MDEYVAEAEKQGLGIDTMFILVYLNSAGYCGRTYGPVWKSGKSNY